MDDASRGAAARFLVYYDEVRRIHREDTGAELREYKPTEPDRVIDTFAEALRSTETGLALLAHLMHTLVWSQCLGNANHRTTVLFMQGILTELEIPFPVYGGEAGAENRFRVAVDWFSDASHLLLDQQSEFGYNPDRLREEHAARCREWLQRQVGDQSLVETTIEPQRLIAFFS